jgi:hypothetical protein
MPTLQGRPRREEIKELNVGAGSSHPPAHAPILALLAYTMAQGLLFLHLEKETFRRSK